MERFFEDEYVQGSEAWKAARAGKIGASDIGTIMGLNPYKTPLALYNEKKGLAPVDELNFFMQRGIELEPIARELAEKEYGGELMPLVLIDEEKPYLMVSLDAISHDNKTIYELKSGKGYYKKAINNECMDMTKAQVLLQIYVAERKFHVEIPHAKVLFLDPDSVDENHTIDTLFGDDVSEPTYRHITYEIRKDPEFLAEMLARAEAFNQCLITNTPPEPMAKDQVIKPSNTLTEFELAVLEELKEIDPQIKELKKRREKLVKAAIEIAAGQSTVCNGVEIKKSIRKGNVDYSKLISELDVEPSKVESFRKPESEVWTIKIQENI